LAWSFHSSLRRIRTQHSNINQQRLFPLDKKRKRSVTPIIAQILNLPPYLRTKIGAQLLLMLTPARATKVGVYLKLLVRELQQLQTPEGISMWNAYEAKWIRVRCTVLYDNNDIVAAPKISGTKAAGSIVGACHVCDVIGVHVPALQTRVYPGAHRYLLSDDRIRLVSPTCLLAWVCRRAGKAMG
jgi:hypothetical protein